MILDLLKENSSAITIIITVIAGIYGFLKFQVYFNDKRFKAYHRLIKELVEPEEENKSIYLDRQIAIIFELRNFPGYYKLSERILTNLKDKWSEDKSPNRLINEIDLTLGYIKKWHRTIIFHIFHEKY